MNERLAMQLTFLGAAGEVTGSQHLVETESRRLLLDCGLFQGRDEETGPKNARFHCAPRRLDAVILSHAHIDHSGNLPGLIKAGYEGDIYCTRATADIASMMLRDSAKIQKEDAAYRSAKENRPVEPLYTEEEAREVVQRFRYVPFGKWETIDPEIRVRFHHAGHILGSAISEIEILDGEEWRRLIFTGDLGRRDKPLLNDPVPQERCDVVITESTYGNRIHPDSGDVKAELQEVISLAAERQSKVIIPAFSLGRTQLLVYLLNELRNENTLCRVPVFIDSPLATRLTEIYRDHQEFMDEDVQETLKFDDDVFDFDGLTYTRGRDESIALNKRPGPFVVISASGMCENGRVVHHLKNAVGDPDNIIMIIGFQAKGSLGRQIVDRREHVYIFGRRFELNAEVRTISGLSAHADAEDFRWWFGEMQKQGGCGHAFIVHGEQGGAEALAELIADTCDHPPIVPQFGESFEV